MGCLVTPRWGCVSWLLPTGGEDGLLGYSSLGVCFMVTSHWGRGWVASLLPTGDRKLVLWLLPAGGEGGLHGDFPLGKLLLWLLPVGEVGFRVTPRWGSWFYIYFPLEKFVSGLFPTGGEGGLHGYSPLGERMGCMGTPFWGRGWVAWLLPAGGEGKLHDYSPAGGVG